MQRFLSSRLLASLYGAGLLLLVALLTPGVAGASGSSSKSGPASAQLGHVVRVPILMYHYIRNDPGRRDPAGEDLSVSPVHFLQQMTYLATSGFHTITLDDLLAAIQWGTPLPSHPIILTFDDGYEDFYTAAYPVLHTLGLRATSFVITGKVGLSGYLTWDQIRAMQASGLVQFESHTVDHADMGHMPLSRAVYEMAASKAILEQQTGTQVLYFCYPAGHYRPGDISLLWSTGYNAGVGTRYGVLHSLSDLAALTRVRIHGADTFASFVAKVTPAK